MQIKQNKLTWLKHFKDEDDATQPDQIEFGQGPENTTTNVKWARPPMKDVDASIDTLIFQQIDLDFYEGTFQRILTI